MVDGAPSCGRIVVVDGGISDGNPEPEGTSGGTAREVGGGRVCSVGEAAGARGAIMGGKRYNLHQLIRPGTLSGPDASGPSSGEVEGSADGHPSLACAGGCGTSYEKVNEWNSQS